MDNVVLRSRRLIAIGDGYLLPFRPGEKQRFDICPKGFKEMMAKAKRQSELTEKLRLPETEDANLQRDNSDKLSLPESGSESETKGKLPQAISSTADLSSMHEQSLDKALQQKMKKLVIKST